MSSPEAETPSAASNPVSGPAARNVVLLARAEWVLAILLSALVLFVVIVRTICAGPLWRDECDSLQHATMPSLSDVIEYRKFTSFPILLPVTVRIYTALFGESDIAIRCIGLAVGILLLTGAWYHARSVDREVPLLPLVLIGLNVNFFTTGLWLRGYGLGSVSIIFAFTLTARFLQGPSRGRLWLVFIAYLTSMHFLLFNGVLVPGIALAAVIVLYRRHEWNWMKRLIGVTAICGLTYLPYIWQVYFGISSWALLILEPVPLDLLFRRFIAACGGSTVAVSLAWLAVIAFCVIAGVLRLKAIWKTDRSRERDMLLFGLSAIPPCTLAYFGFVRVLRNVPLQRHFLALTCFLAIASTLIAATFSSNYRLRVGRMACVIVMLIVLPFAPWGRLNERMSNMDVIVRQIAKEAGPNDLIVVNPISVGISFNHYYHGPNRWFTAPKIEDHRVHRYDLLQKKMMEFFPLEDVEQEITGALKAGYRVWIVGTISITATEREPLVLAPAPDPQFGWQSGPYVNSWSQQLGEFLRRHARRIDLVVHHGKSVNERENLWLIGCDGWR